MKTTLFTIILSLYAFISIDAITPSTLAIEEKKPIDIESEDQNERVKSLVIPFEAWQTDNKEIEILSYHACTNVTISICTTGGQVLDIQTLSFASMQSVALNTNDYDSGYYQVKITTSAGTEYTGTFIIE